MFTIFTPCPMPITYSRKKEQKVAQNFRWEGIVGIVLTLQGVMCYNSPIKNNVEVASHGGGNVGWLRAWN
jgi:hypothetical protein